MSHSLKTTTAGFSSSVPVGSSVTEKRTVITKTSSSTNNDDPGDFYYRSSISPRTSTFNKSSPFPYSTSSGGGRISRKVEITSGYHVPNYTGITSPGVTDFKSTREREKKDMRDLNERFANYIEKVRFLEAQNRKLASELEDLRNKWGKETNAVKSMYETELEEARKIIDDTNKDRNRLQVRVGQLEERLEDIQRQLDEAKKWRAQDRDTINKLNQQVSELEAELRMLRRTNDSMDTDRQRDKQTIARLTEELDKLRMDLSNETIQRLDAENRAQTLAEELEFLKSVHEQELKELAALAYRDTTAENREFWKNELSQAIRDIEIEYDSKLDAIRGEMESFYNLKVQEFRTGATKNNMEVTQAREETKKLHKIISESKMRIADLEARNAQLEKQMQDLLRELEQKDQEHLLECNQLKDEINKLRAEVESMLLELQSLLDAKLSLELEICAYRKLLETEESRAGIPPRRPLRSAVTVQEPASQAKPTSLAKPFISGMDTPSGGSAMTEPGQQEEPPPTSAAESVVNAKIQVHSEQTKEIVTEVMASQKGGLVEGQSTEQQTESWKRESSTKERVNVVEEEEEPGIRQETERSTLAEANEKSADEKEEVEETCTRDESVALKEEHAVVGGEMISDETKVLEKSPQEVDQKQLPENIAVEEHVEVQMKTQVETQVEAPETSEDKPKDAEKPSEEFKEEPTTVSAQPDETKETIEIKEESETEEASEGKPQKGEEEEENFFDMTTNSVQDQKPEPKQYESEITEDEHQQTKEDIPPTKLGLEAQEADAVSERAAEKADNKIENKDKVTKDEVKEEVMEEIIVPKAAQNIKSQRTDKVVDVTAIQSAQKENKDEEEDVVDEVFEPKEAAPKESQHQEEQVVQQSAEQETGNEETPTSEETHTGDETDVQVTKTAKEGTGDLKKPEDLSKEGGELTESLGETEKTAESKVDHSEQGKRIGKDDNNVRVVGSEQLPDADRKETGAKETVDKDESIDTKETVDKDESIDTKETVDKDESIDTKETVDKDESIDTKETVDKDESIDTKETVDKDESIDTKETVDEDESIDTKETVDKDESIDSKETVDKDESIDTKETVDKEESIDTKIGETEDIGVEVVDRNELTDTNTVDTQVADGEATNEIVNADNEETRETKAAESEETVEMVNTENADFRDPQTVEKEDTVETEVADNEETIEAGTADNEETIEEGTAENEETVETGSAENEENAETRTDGKKETIETETADNEETIQIGTADNEETIQTGTADKEETIEEGTADNEETIETGTTDKEETIETGTADNEETKESETAESEETRDTETAESEETVETETADNEETTERGTADKEETIETVTADEEETIKTGTADKKETLGTETAENEETVDTGTAENEEIVDTVTNDKEETRDAETAVNEETSDTKAAVKEETIETKAAVKEETIETKAAVKEEAIETKAAVKEEAIETKAAIKEETIETKAAVKEEAIETKAAVKEETIETKAAVKEETIETKAAVKEETIETKAAVKEEAIETKAAIKEETIETKAAVKEEAIETKAAVKEETIETKAAVKEETIETKAVETETIQNEETIETETAENEETLETDAADKGKIVASQIADEKAAAETEEEKAAEVDEETTQTINIASSEVAPSQSIPPESEATAESPLEVTPVETHEATQATIAIEVKATKEVQETEGHEKERRISSVKPTGEGSQKETDLELRRTKAGEEPKKVKGSENRDAMEISDGDGEGVTEDTATEKKEDRRDEDKGNNTEEEVDEIEDTTQELEKASKSLEQKDADNTEDDVTGMTPEVPAKLLSETILEEVLEELITPTIIKKEADLDYQSEDSLHKVDQRPEEGQQCSHSADANATRQSSKEASKDQPEEPSEGNVGTDSQTPKEREIPEWSVEEMVEEESKGSSGARDVPIEEETKESKNTRPQIKAEETTSLPAHLAENEAKMAEGKEDAPSSLSKDHKEKSSQEPTQAVEEDQREPEVSEDLGKTDSETVEPTGSKETDLESSQPEQEIEANGGIDDDIVEKKFDFRQYETDKKAGRTSRTVDSHRQSEFETTALESSPASSSGKTEEDGHRLGQREDDVARKSLKAEEKDMRSETTDKTSSLKTVPANDNSDSQLSMKMMRGEVSAKTTYQRTANGPVSIAETHPDGKCVVLENNPSSGVRKDVNLLNWTLQRVVDNKRKITYKFPPNAVIKLGKTLKTGQEASLEIWAAGSSSERGAGDLVFTEEDTWGTGAQITTTLYNDKNEEKACHIQKTLYS